MVRYLIRFEDNIHGEWYSDFLSNKGCGFTEYEAQYVANRLKEQGCRNITIEEYRR